MVFHMLIKQQPKKSAMPKHRANQYLWGNRKTKYWEEFSFLKVVEMEENEIIAFDFG